MHRLPQSVLAHIYEYDPTYRVVEHQKQMTALKARNISYDYEHEWKQVDFIDSFAFQFSMYMGSAVYLSIGIPIYALISLCRMIFVSTGIVFERIYRVL